MGSSGVERERSDVARNVTAKAPTTPTEETPRDVEKGEANSGASKPPLAPVASAAPSQLVDGPKAAAPSSTMDESASYGMVGLARGGVGQGFGAGSGGIVGHVAKMRASASVHGASAGRMAAPAPSRPLAVAQPQMKDDAFNTEAYKSIHENPFRLVSEAPLSTFSADVDTASYSNMRRFVQEGHRPPQDSIRVEEWVNYFGYDDPLPTGPEPFAVTTELTDCPWAKDHRLLRVALATKPIEEANVPPRNLVFLIDVSGSMEPANKLPLLKRGLAMLARQLRPTDTVSIVVYAGASGLALPPTSGADQAKILGALENLEAGGSTNGAEGIKLAYELAEHQFKKGGINRVILATDGDFNVGTTSEGELERLMEEKRKSGVFLTLLGFGEENLKDSTMEMLADKGNGNYAYIDSLAEAKKVLVREAGATLVTVAKDVKLQIEFNPTHVKSYRLVGYEDRVLADQDFNDDTKDAGEMGAGHHVTAFYELVPAQGHDGAAPPQVDPLRYQAQRTPSAPSASDELATVKIRYKPPTEATSALLSRTVWDRSAPLASASENQRFGAAVAEYALALREAPGVGANDTTQARSLASSALGFDPHGERHEFLTLMDRAATLPKQ
jgi:Ca-activated chloride channel family protein